MVVGLDLGAHALAARGRDAAQQPVDEDRAQAGALLVVADDDRQLALAGARVVGDRAGDAEQLVRAVAVEATRATWRAAVDLGEEAQVAPGQVALHRVVAAVARVLRQAGVEGHQRGLVLGADVAQANRHSGPPPLWRTTGASLSAIAHQDASAHGAAGYARRVHGARRARRPTPGPSTRSRSPTSRASPP